MGSLQLVTIVKQAPKKLNLTHQQLEDACAKAMKGKGHVGEGVDFYDFLTKNRWALGHVLGNKDEIINGHFECEHNCRYHAYYCGKCEGIFQLPFEATICMFCENTELDKEKRKVRLTSTVGRAGLTDGVNPELYAQAVKDIQENGSAPSGEPEYDLDWGYLEDNI